MKPRFYFTVPGPYGYPLSTHSSFESAELAALATIEHVTDTPNFTRAWVEVRRQDEDGDRPLDRIEMFLDDTAKMFARETQAPRA